MSATELIETISSPENMAVDSEQEDQIDDQQTNEVQAEDERKQERYQYDVIVIGSGPGGYTSAVRCAQLGRSVAIVERDLLGGHAVNWGCIPVNAMMASARLIRSIRESARYGVDIPTHRIDFLRIARRRDEAVKKARSQIKTFLQKCNIQVYIGIADIIDPNHVVVKPIRKYTFANLLDADGRSPYETDDFVSIQTELELSSENIIIASGVEYDLPKFVETDDKKTLHPIQLLWQRNIPESLVIIGGGVLGCEFAALYSHLRSNVVLIEKHSRLLKFMDQQVSLAVEARLQESGVEIIFNANIEKIHNGEVVMQLRELNSTRTLSGSLVVVCTGRKPTFNYETLRKLGIAIDTKQARIIIDENTCRTSLPNIYACGGIVSSCWSWVPCAIRQGHLAANAICKETLEGESKFQISNNAAAPFVVNVIPAIASVGEVPQFEDDTLIYTYDFKANRRAIIDHQNWGFIKMWTTRDEPKRFLAVQLVHEAAAEIIEYYSMIIALDIPLRDVCLLPFAHPTYTESVKEACEYVLGRSVTYKGNYLN